MSKLCTQNTEQAKQFQPKMYQGKGRDQDKNNYYDGGRQEMRSHKVEIGLEDQHTEENHSLDKIYLIKCGIRTKNRHFFEIPGKQ